MSDNGAPSQCPQNVPLRGHKVSPYEGGIRDPMIVKWPGVTTEGTVCNTPVIIEDFFPSILDMAGSDKYKKSEEVIDGISFTSLLHGKTTDVSDRSFIWHFPHNYDFEPYSVIRKGDWKLIYWYKDGREELYNIAEDISENKDISLLFPEIRSSLVAELGRYLKSVDTSVVSIKHLIPTVIEQNNTDRSFYQLRSNGIYFNAADKTTVNFYTIEGQLVFSSSFYNDHLEWGTSLHTGIYFIRIQRAQKNFTNKIIITR